LRKIKLSIDEQIKNMQEKGVKFNIIDGYRAKEILENSSYYFKIKSYCKNYKKDDQGKYIDLEFAYLYEFSKLDMYFRRIILNISLDIEHSLKVAILRDFNKLKNNGEDIVNGFLGSDLGKSTSIYLSQSRSRGDQSISTKLIQNNIPPNMPFWVLVEVIQLGDLRKLYEYFYKRFPNLMSITRQRDLNKMIFSAKSLRNCAAHNNCIFTNIFERQVRVQNICKTKLAPYKLQLEKNIGDRLDGLLQNQHISDFFMMVLLFVEMIRSCGLKNHIKKDISDFFKRTCMTRTRKRYFLKNKAIRDRMVLIYRCYRILSLG